MKIRLLKLQREKENPIWLIEKKDFILGWIRYSNDPGMKTLFHNEDEAIETYQKLLISKNKPNLAVVMENVISVDIFGM